MKFLLGFVIVSLLSFVHADSIKANGVTYVVSNSSWKYSETLILGWTELGFDDSSWGESIAPSAGLCPVNDQEVPTNIGEYGALPMWKPNPSDHETAYFRKTFEITSNSTGQIRAVFDDTGEIYINGEKVLEDIINDGRDLSVTDVTPYLVHGKNQIAVRVSDSAGFCQTLQFELALTEQIIEVPVFGGLGLFGASLGSLGGFWFLRRKV